MIRYPNRTDAECNLIDTLYHLKSERKSYAAYCTATTELRMQRFTGKWDKQGAIMETYTVPQGTILKIVMVSRLESFGLTDDLTAENGYSLQLMWDTQDVKDIRKQP